MKPVPAVVEAAIDVEAIGDRIVVALNEERSLDANIVNLQAQLAKKRVAIGQLLNEARPAWPERGPTAKGWGAFLARVGIDDVTAWRYRELAGAVSFSVKETPDPLIPTYAEIGLDNRPDSRPDPKPVNGNGGSGDPHRGTYCTPKEWAIAVGRWGLDPFSNPRSHILAGEHLSLERGDDGLLDLAQPGSYYRAPRTEDEKRVAQFNREAFMCVATVTTRVFLQPPYELAAEAIAHYGHTRFCALLRLDPSPEWAELLWPRVKFIAIPFRTRLEFEPPPGIPASASPYPHAFYYTHEEDITDEIRRLCIVLRVEDLRLVLEEMKRRRSDESAELPLNERE